MDRNQKEDTDNQEISYDQNISGSEPLKLLSERDLEESSWKNLPIYIICFFITLSGLTAIIQPLTTRLSNNPKLFELLNIYDYYHWSKSISICFGLFLILLSFNLLKRKKVAWSLAFYSCLISILIHLFRNGSEYIVWIKDRELSELVPSLASIIPILTVILLFQARKRFTVRSERGDLSNALFVLVVSLSTLLFYASIGFWLQEVKDFGINFQFDESVVRGLKELFFIGNPDLEPRSRFALWYLNSIRIAEIATLLFVSVSLFKPIKYKYIDEPKERELASTLLNQHGSDALDHYKLLNDKSYFFNEENSAFLAYKTVLGVAICLGDPVGPKQSLESLMKSFKAYCHGNDWKIACLQVKEDNLDMFQSVGLKVLKVGEDAIVDLDEFSINTIKKKTFKQPLKKLSKQGYELKKYVPPHTDAIITAVENISNEWLQLPGRKERGFSLGWFEEDVVRESTLFVLESQDGVPIAFVNQVRSYAPDQVSIDMMRHLKDVPNGAMDYLFAKLLQSLHEEGFKSFSLGLAALSGVGESKSDTKEEKAVHMIYEHMNHFFSYKGLRNYKSKFKPTWEDRFLIYEGTTASLIKTALAITRAGNISD